MTVGKSRESRRGRKAQASIGHRIMDLHAHGIGRYETRGASPGEILKIAGEFAKKGVCAILPTIYPGPVPRMRGDMEAVRGAMDRQGQKKAGRGDTSHHHGREGDSLAGECEILGVNLEGPFLNPLRCGALGPGSFLAPSKRNLSTLISGYEDMIRIITIAPEVKGALALIERCAVLGIRVNMGHSDATFREAGEGKRAGATGITHLFNAMRPLHHREPGIAGFGLLDEDLYVEVIADGVHLHPAMLRLIFSQKRGDRIILVSDSVKRRRIDGGGVYDDHGVLCGSALTVRDVVPAIEQLGISRDAILRAAAEKPCRYVRGSRQRS